MATARAAVARVLIEWSGRLFALGAIAVVLAQVGLYLSVELNTKAPLGYLLLLAAGVALFALGSSGEWFRRRDSISGPLHLYIPSLPDIYARTARSQTRVAALALGIISFVALTALLVSGSKSAGALVPWVLGLCALGVPFLPQRPAWQNTAGTWCWEQLARFRWDFAFVLLLMAIFLAINIYDLENWYYSAIGDEFLFYEHARQIIDEGITDPFSQEGVYSKHPVMNSVSQAVVMRVFGADYFGWTFSELLNAALTIPAIYLLGRAVGGRPAAVAASAVFAFSHYMFAFSHVGYTNLSPLPVSAWAVALFVWGCRRDSPLLLYAAGIVAGMGFYTHYSGRAIMPIILLFALTVGRPQRIWNLWPLALGFILTVAPTFIVEREGVLTRMFGQVVGGYSEDVAGSTLSRLLENIEINLQAFHYSPTVHTYVYGPLLDPVSGCLSALGIAYALGHVRWGAFRLLLVWFAIAIFMTGILSPYPHVAVTRVSFVLPPLAIMAGLLVERFLGSRHKESPEKRGTSRVALFAVGVIMLPLILALNLWQFWHVTPSVQPHTQEALAFAAFRSDACGADLETTVFAGRATGDGSLMQRLLATFYPDGPGHRYVEPSGLPAGEGIEGSPPRCVVFLDPGSAQSRELQQTLQHQYPDGRVELVVNPSKTSSVEVFVRD